MLVKLHGILAERYGKEHRIEATSAAEAIEGFSRQVDFFGDVPLEKRPVCRVVGYEDPSLLYEEKELNEVHLVPAMIGGGSFARIIIGAVIIAVAIALPLSLPITMALVSFGASIALGGIMMLFTKAPTVSKSTDPEASQYLGISDNSVAIGTPIPIQYGRGPATGHLLAVNVDSSEMVIGTFPATVS